MEFEQFADTFTKHMTEQFKTLELRRANVDKLQGQSYHGLVIKDPEGPVGVSINLDSYYRKLETGQSMDSVLTEAYTDILHMDLTPPVIDIEMLKDYDAMKQYLIMQLVPVEGNEEMLEKVPYRLFGDLAIVYRFLLPKEGSAEASILVTRENLRSLDVEAETVAMDAAFYSEKNHPMTVRNIADVLFGPEDREEDGESPLWVISNDCGRYGASVITYPEALARIGEMIGSDYYLAPSSVHEMLAIPDDAGVDGAGLDEMVRSVNQTEVAREDQLVNHSYHYDCSRKLLEDTRVYEARLSAMKETEEQEADILYGAFPEG